MPDSITVDAAFELFSHPRRHPRTEAEIALLALAERNLVPCGPEKLAVWSWGAGPAVLMVHGWEGRASQFHAFVPRLLDHGFRAVAMDCPAHGDSSGIATSIPHVAEAVAAVANAVGEIAAVIGHSGGSAASVYAFTRALKTTCSVHLAGPTSLARGVDRFCAAIGFSEPDRAEFRRRFEDFIGMPLRETDLAKLQLPDRPALLLHDPADKEVPFSETELLAAHWPTATLRVVHSVGHRRIMRNKEVVDQVLHFIRNNVPSR